MKILNNNHSQKDARTHRQIKDAIARGDIKSYTFDDILAYKEKRVVTIEGNCVVLRITYEYQIELNRINSHKKLIEWVRHLCTKPWVDGQVIKQLIDVVYKHFGWRRNTFL